jgi:hypothetical protein
LREVNPSMERLPPLGKLDVAVPPDRDIACHGQQRY